MYKKHIGFTLLGLSIIASFSVFLFIVYANFSLIIEKAVIGSFSLLFFIFYGGASFVVWLISFMVYPSTKLHWLYFIGLFSSVALFIIFPLVFSA